MRLKRFIALLLTIIISFLGSKAILNILDQKEMEELYAGDSSYNDQAIKDNKNEYLILLVGVDKNGDYNEDDDYTRTDTIMLVKANVETGMIDILSIPRDSRVKIRDDFDKINHAHAFGGIDLSMQSLRNFLGLDIDYYVQVDYKAVENIIDALGGVDYKVPSGVSIRVGSLKINEGMNHFDGKHAMWYLRTRKIYDNGDIGRVNAQQDFMKAMVDEMVKKSKNVNLTTFALNYVQYVKTNLPAGIIINLAKNIEKFSSKNVNTHVVPGEEETIDGTSYWIVDYEKTWDIVDDRFHNFKLKNWTKEKSGLMDEKNQEKIPDDSNNEQDLDPNTYQNENYEYSQPAYENTIDTSDDYYYEDDHYYEDDYYEDDYYYEEPSYEEDDNQDQEEVEESSEKSSPEEKSDTSDKEEDSEGDTDE